MQSIPTNQNKEIEEFIEGDYISIKEGESRVLEFDISKMKLVDKTDFNGNPAKKVQFIVVNPEDPQRREKKFELSKKHVPKIYNEQQYKSFAAKDTAKERYLKYCKLD
jgi:hypothetical protein